MEADGVRRLGAGSGGGGLSTYLRTLLGAGRPAGNGLALKEVAHAAVSVVSNLAMVEANRAAILEGRFVPYLLAVNGGSSNSKDSDGGPGSAAPTASADADTAGALASSSAEAPNYPLLEVSLQTLYMLCYPSDLRSLILAQGGRDLCAIGLCSGSHECRRWALWIETVLK